MTVHIHTYGRRKAQDAGEQVEYRGYQISFDQEDGDVYVRLNGTRVGGVVWSLDSAKQLIDNDIRVRGPALKDRKAKDALTVSREKLREMIDQGWWEPLTDIEPAIAEHRAIEVRVYRVLNGERGVMMVRVEG